MNIVDFMEKDHQAYQTEFAGIRKGLGKARLSGRIIRLISHCELHECVEQRVLSELKALPKAGARCEWILDYKGNHERMWGLLAKLRDSLWTKDDSLIRRAFFDFHSFAERYIRIERFSLFPVLREALGENVLQELGRRAQKHYRRFLPRAA